MREHHREIVAWLDAVGATAIRIEQRGRHPHVVFCWAGRELRSPIAGSPGDFHATRAQLKNLRHMLGLVGGKRVGERRQRKRHRRGIAPAIDPRRLTRFVPAVTAPFNTPFAELAALREGAAM